MENWDELEIYETSLANQLQSFISGNSYAINDTEGGANITKKDLQGTEGRKLCCTWVEKDIYMF